ncbi:hypothetical protein pdam_00025174, partial [Pocillopora damicornis]
MPSCTCPDWQRHHWLCKHFVAIYKHFPERGWEAMSPSYRFSPKRERQRIKEYSSKFTSITQSPVANEDLEKKAEVAGKSSKQSVSMQNEGRCCRELLKEIQDLTYLCESLKQDLQKALGKFHPLVPSENGIFMQEKTQCQNKVSDFPEYQYSLFIFSKFVIEEHNSRKKYRLASVFLVSLSVLSVVQRMLSRPPVNTGAVKEVLPVMMLIQELFWRVYTQES